jgi:hypothetical protein
MDNIIKKYNIYKISKNDKIFYGVTSHNTVNTCLIQYISNYKRYIKDTDLKHTYYHSLFELFRTEGYEDLDVEIIESIETNDIKIAKTKLRFYIETPVIYKTIVNSTIPTRCQSEYYRDVCRSDEYKIKLTNFSNGIINKLNYKPKSTSSQLTKQPDYKKIYNLNYYEKNKHKVLDTLLCEICNKEICKASMKKHTKSDKHILNLQKINL